MFCQNCGKELQNGEIYCSRCGTKAGESKKNIRVDFDLKEKIQEKIQGLDGIGKGVDRLEDNMPTVTTVTPRAIAFYISSAVTVICMFLNWISIDFDLGFMQINDLLGDVTIFNLAGILNDIKNSLGFLTSFLPADISNGISVAYFFSVIVMILGIFTILLYICSVILRIMGNRVAGRVSLFAGICAVFTPTVFIILVGCVLSAIDLGGYLMDVLTLPCWLALLCAVVSVFCSKVDVINEDKTPERYYTEMLTKKIEDYPHDPDTEWVCSSCGAINKYDDRFCQCGCGVALK